MPSCPKLYYSKTIGSCAASAAWCKMHRQQRNESRALQLVKVFFFSFFTGQNLKINKHRNLPTEESRNVSASAKVHPPPTKTRGCVPLAIRNSSSSSAAARWQSSLPRNGVAYTSAAPIVLKITTYQQAKSRWKKGERRKEWALFRTHSFVHTLQRGSHLLPARFLLVPSFVLWRFSDDNKAERGNTKRNA